jgi:hypothetical protein
LGIDVAENRSNMVRTMSLFEKSLELLLNGDGMLIPGSPSPEVTAQVKKVEEQWKLMKAALQSGQREVVSKQNLVLLKEAHEVVELYEKAASAAGHKTMGAVVNIAGRQRMLSQRVFKDVVMLGARNAREAKDLRADTKAVRAQFEKALVGLVKGNREMDLPATSDEAVLNHMKTVEQAWREFSAKIDQALAVPEREQLPNELLKEMAEANTAMLLLLERATTMYTELRQSS